MKLRFFAFLFALLVVLPGCSSIALRDMVATTPEVEVLRAKNVNAQGVVSTSTLPQDGRHFERFFGAMTDAPVADSVSVRAASDDAYLGSTTNQLVRSAVVQSVVQRVHASVVQRVHAAVTSNTPTDTEISARELTAFGKLLSANSGALLSELTTNTAGVRRLNIVAADGKARKFDKVLLAYLTEYGSGEFVDRLGNNISKPSLSSSGFTDEDIQGLATVFFEAMFDCWFADMPLFYSVKSKEDLIYSPLPNPTYDAGKTEDVSLAACRT
ncbi:MAG: hypothetical protein ACREBC_24400 [Pyrinomonadaceae bacterium]